MTPASPATRTHTHRTDDRADDIRLCVSELAWCTAPPRGREFRVYVTVEDGSVRVEVHDASGTRPYLCAPDDTADRGRGLRLVDALADDWGTSDRTGVGKVVWVVFKEALALWGGGPPSLKWMFTCGVGET